MKNRKMIVVDLDGTLLNINQKCSEKAKKYLKKLKDMGHIVVIATGRVLRSAVEITGGASFADYVISGSGSVVYDMNNSKIIMKNTIDKDMVKYICSNFNEDIKFIDVCDLFYHNRYSDTEDCCRKFVKKLDNIDNYLNNIDYVVSLTVELNGNDFVDKYYELFSNDNLQILVMQDSYDDEQSLEIFNKGVSKYNAVKVIMDIENISNDDVIAFGDGLNDVDMIQLSGVGVAMGNALDTVKDVSDYVTISHNEDGVIYFLRGYFKENNLLG